MSEPVSVTPLKTFVLGATTYPAGKAAEIDPAYVPLLQDQGFLAKEGEATEPKATDEAVNPEAIRPLEPGVPGAGDLVPAGGEPVTTPDETDAVSESGVNPSTTIPRTRFKRRGEPAPEPEPEPEP